MSGYSNDEEQFNEPAQTPDVSDDIDSDGSNEQPEDRVDDETGDNLGSTRSNNRYERSEQDDGDEVHESDHGAPNDDEENVVNDQEDNEQENFVNEQEDDEQENVVNEQEDDGQDSDERDYRAPNDDGEGDAFGKNESAAEYGSSEEEEDYELGAVAHGSHPDTQDSRDHTFHPLPLHAKNNVVDLRNFCPPVWNQGQMMSCTAHAVAAAFEWEARRMGSSQFSPSRLFIWYNARVAELNTNKNAGTQIRNAIKSIATGGRGVCPEQDWPYRLGKTQKSTSLFYKGEPPIMPPKKSFQDALQHYATRYLRVNQNESDMRNCLDQGYPFIVGLNTYGRLDGLTGVLKPATAEERKRPADGHALLVVGHDDSDKMNLLVRNSWGADWGPQGDGHFWMTSDCVIFDCYDIWTIRAIKN